jgi:hypothetical protein
MEPVILRIWTGSRFLIEDAVGWIDAPSGSRRWSGRFTAKRGHEIVPGGPYLVEMTDGRSGQIMIESPVTAGQPAEVSFTGIGQFG